MKLLDNEMVGIYDDGVDQVSNYNTVRLYIARNNKQLGYESMTPLDFGMDTPNDESRCVYKFSRRIERIISSITFYIG